MPGFARSADGGRRRADVRRPGRSAVGQIVHARDRECAAARDGARPIYPPAKMASCLASVALSLFFSASRRCAHLVAASSLPIAFSSPSMASRKRADAAMSRRTAASSFALSWSTAGLACRASGVRAASWTIYRPASPLLRPGLRLCAGCGLRRADQIRRIEIILAGDADQREQGIAPGIGQCRAHAVRPFGLGNRTDRPIRGDPFA